MSDYKERRNYPRVLVDGANVAYKVKAGFDLFSRFSSYYPLRDLAKGGICFELDSKLPRGTTVELKLEIPREGKILIKGTVVWVNNITNNNRIFAGVQFLPFGKGKMYNTFESWDKLEQIITTNGNGERLN